MAQRPINGSTGTGGGAVTGTGATLQHFYAASPSTSTSASSVNLPLTDPIFTDVRDPFSMQTGTAVVIQQAGRYEINLSAVSNSDIVMEIDGVISAYTDSPSLDTPGVIFWTGDLTVGQSIEFISRAPNGSDLARAWQQVMLSVEQLPSSEAVVAGTVTPEETTGILSESTSTLVPAGTATVDIEWDTPSLDSGAFTTADNITFTVAEAGTYELSGYVQRNGAQDYYATMKYTPNGGSEETLWQTGGNGIANIVGTQDAVNGGTFSLVKTMAVGDTFNFDIRADATGDAAGSLHVKQAKQKSVVMQDALEVEALASGSATLAANFGVTQGYADVNELTVTLPNDGDYVVVATLSVEGNGDDVFTSHVLTDAANNPLSTEMYSRAADFSTGDHHDESITLYHEIYGATAGDVVKVRSQQADNNDTVSVRAGARIYYRQLPSKTVINTTDLEITNPNDAGVLESNQDGTATFVEDTKTVVTDLSASDIAQVGSGTTLYYMDDSLDPQPGGGETVLVTNQSQYLEVGKIRYYDVRLRVHDDSSIEWTVPNSEYITNVQLNASTIGDGTGGSGNSWEAPGITTFISGNNTFTINRDNDVDAVIYVQLSFIAHMQ